MTDLGHINFYTRKWVRPEDLNAHGTPFRRQPVALDRRRSGGLRRHPTRNKNKSSPNISEINFVASATVGDIIEIGLVATNFGRTSITMRAEVRNIITGSRILTIDTMVFVAVDDVGRPTEHGHATMTRSRERLHSPQ